MSITTVLKRFYLPEDPGGPQVDRSGMRRQLLLLRRVLAACMGAIFILVFVCAATGLWLATQGKVELTWTSPFLGGATFLVLIELMRRIAREWTYLGLLLLAVEDASEKDLRALMLRIMDATSKQGGRLSQGTTIDDLVPQASTTRPRSQKSKHPKGST